MGRNWHFNSIKNARTRLSVPLEILHLEGRMKPHHHFPSSCVFYLFVMHCLHDSIEFFDAQSSSSLFKRRTRLKWHPDRNWNVRKLCGEATIWILFLTTNLDPWFTYFPFWILSSAWQCKTFVSFDMKLLLEGDLSGLLLLKYKNNL